VCLLAPGKTSGPSDAFSIARSQDQGIACRTHRSCEVEQNDPPFAGGYQLFPDNPSFRAVAKSTLNISREALDAVRGGVLSVARNALAFVLTRPLGATVLITALCASTFCAVGYVHYKHAASDERIAAQRTERANADLQDALDRLRDELAAPPQIASDRRSEFEHPTANALAAKVRLRVDDA